MMITPNQDFKHNGRAYCEGESYDVSDEDCTYFLVNGWVGDKALPVTHSLDIHTGQLGHSSEVN